jgi:hypothetical protein
MAQIGKTTWVIPEGYIPSDSVSKDPALLSHETACILNAGDGDAQVQFMIYFTDREPVGPYTMTVPARRTAHVRFNDLKDPEPVPLDTDYACVVTSDVPIVVQHTRLDSRMAEISLMTTMAYGEG